MPNPSNSKNEKKMGFIYYQNKSIFVIFCFFTNNKNEYIWNLFDLHCFLQNSLKF